MTCKALWKMYRLVFIQSMLLLLTGCSQPDKLTALLPGSWEMVNTDSQEIRCAEFGFQGKLPMVRVYEKSHGDKAKEFLGLWHALRGQRLQMQIGPAFDNEGNEIPITELRLYHRRNYALAGIQENVFVMKDDDKDKWRVQRVENCEEVMSGFRPS